MPMSSGVAPTSAASLAVREAPGMTGLGRWVLGARPRTLPAAVVPVAVGIAMAARPGSYAGLASGLHSSQWARAAGALVVSLAIQVGTNYANDYSDGIRGTDADRVGPPRLVASGLASPRRVRAAALASFAVACLAGIVLAAETSWWLLPIGAACLAAGWLYTGGPKPYGYLGFGELFVFGFFGLVATAGTTYVVADRFVWQSLLAAVPVGMLAVALLEANNLRDIDSDREASKLTLAVRLGRRRAGLLYLATLLAALLGAVALALVSTPGALVCLLAVPLAPSLVSRARSGAEGTDLLPMLAGTGRLQLIAGLLLALGVLL